MTPTDAAPRSVHLAVVAMALAILCSLLVLTSMILNMAKRTEETLSQDMVAEVRTRLLAERAIRTAVDRLRAWAATEAIDGPHCPWTAVEYQDRNGSGSFEPAHDLVLHDRHSEPTRRMRHPSFAPPHPFSLQNEPIRIPDENADGHPETVGYSFRYPAQVEEGMDLATVKVLDCASMIYVNGPTAEPGGWNLAPNAIRLLNHLGDSPEIGIQGLGLILDAWRRTHRKGFETRRDIIRALRQAGVPDRRIETLRDLLTCQAWVDLRTLQPGSLVEGPPAGSGPSPAGKIRWGGLPGPRWALPAGILRRLWPSCNVDLLLGEGAGGPLAPPTPQIADRPHPPRYGSGRLLQPRAPVNVNTASVEVLVAVLTDLGASTLDRSVRLSFPMTTSPGQMTRTPDACVDARTARTVAEYLHAQRLKRPFRNWEEFEAFLLGIPDEDVSPLRKQVILAAVNPNSRLSAFNPDRTFGMRHGDVDKAALGEWRSGTWNAAANSPFCGWTTEFCFSSMGYYQIDCLVRLLGRARNGLYPVLSERSVECVVQVYDVVRLTTQKDFLTHWRSTTMLGPDAPAVTTGPEPVRDLQRVWWHGPDGLAARCLDLPESGPPGKPTCNHALCWDGHLSLASLDPRPGKAPLFYADFAAGLEARSGDESLPAQGTADAHRSLIDPTDPSELFSDGVFCHETRRVGFSPDARRYGNSRETLDEYLSYEAPAAFPSVGWLELWIKPTWDGDELYDAAAPGPGGAAEAEDTRTLFSCGRGVEPAPAGTEEVGGASDHLVLFARKGLLAAVAGDTRVAPGEAPKGARPAFVFSSPERPWCAGFRAVATPIRHWRAGEWHHVRLSWSDRSLGLEVDGQRALSPPLRTVVRSFALGVPRGWKFFIGTNRFRDGRCNGFPLTADATIDGLALHAGSVPSRMPPPDRYPAGPEPLGLVLEARPDLDFPCAGPTYTLGTLSWNGRAPAAGGAIALTAGLRPADFPSLPRPSGPRSASGWLTLGGSQERTAPALISCAFFPVPPGPGGFVAESPLLEDVTLTVIGAPRFASWWVKEGE